MSRDIPDFELESIKRMIDSVPDDVDLGISEEFSYDSIMAEFEYTTATAGGKRSAPVQKFVDPDTASLLQTVDEIKKMTDGLDIPEEPEQKPKQKKEKAPKPEKEKKAPAPAAEDDFEIKIDASVFGPPIDFNQTFKPAPSHDRVPDDAGGEAGSQMPRTSVVRRFAEHVKKDVPVDDISPSQAAVRLAPYLGSLHIRIILSFIVLLPLMYITFALPFGWPVPELLIYSRHPYIYLLAVAVLLLLIMLCGVDFIAKGFSDLYHLRPNSETLVCFSCIASIAHVISILIAPTKVIGFLPYCSVSAASLFFGMWGQYTLFRARRRTYKTISDAKADVFSVFREEHLYDNLSGYTKHPADAKGFVRRTEDPDILRKAMAFLSPILLVAQFVLAFLVSAGQGHPGFFFWAWAAISSVTVPFATFFSFSLPFYKVTARLSFMGAAIAGWFAAKCFADGSYIVIGDKDLFPPGKSTLNGLKIIGNHSFDKVTSYAASLLSESDSGLYGALQELLKDQTNVLKNVMSFEHYEGGGVGGDIDGQRVLLGSSSFILRMGIRLPRDLNIKNALFVAISMEVAGVFAINYSPTESVESALHLLGRQKITPILAVRDFNISPTLIKTKYKINPDFLEFPPIEERLALSDPGRGGSAKVAAIVVKEGLNPFAESIVAGARLFKTARINTLVNVLICLAGVLFMLYFTYTSVAGFSLAPPPYTASIAATEAAAAAAAAINPVNVLLFQLLWLLPSRLISLSANRY